MAIKLKKFSYSKGIQLTVFIILVALLCGLSFMLANNYNSLRAGSLIDSQFYSVEKKLLDDSYKVRSQLLTLASFYKDEEYIKSGATVTNEKLAQRKEELFYQKNYDIQNLLERQQRYGDLGKDIEINNRTLWTTFEENYQEEIADIPNQLILEDLYNYRILYATINSYKDIYYLVYGDDFWFSNVESPTEEYFLGFSHHYAYTEYEGASAYQVLLAYDDFYAAELEAKIAEDNLALAQVLPRFRLICIASLMCLFYLIITTGRKNEDESIHLFPTDRIYIEFNLALLAAAFALAVGTLTLLANHSLDYILLLTGQAILIAFGLALFLSLVRQWKTRSFFKNSVIWVLIAKLAAFINKLLASGTLMRQVAAVIVVLGLVAMIPVIGPIIAIVAGLWLGYNLISRFNRISAGAEKVKSGDYRAMIDIDQPREFKKLSDNINQIAGGLNREVERRLKSERLKTDLISNVSHDIRTPLTSVITYIDLLKNEEIESLQARQYIEVIEQKANRLKALIDDLFEASKASSGNIPVALGKVDIVALIQQGLGELDDKIQASALDFKVNVPSYPVYVWADGKLLWRVVENLIANVLKYALEKSRIYLDLKEGDFQVEVEIKNISAYELNIAEDELMERFKRGDESRHSEGSGLGLSIARSLMLSQKGSLNIKIDGDLFKAIVSIPKLSEEELGL